ncbi:MAG TPA: hypothetical protein VMZ03_06270 [Chitinophagaceae bacterium]|nr:hypothetical protein [Chitinophagaceae bacterium]
MCKRWSILPALLLLVAAAQAQGNPSDTSIAPKDKDLELIDTTLNYDELFQDFDAFMDSILSPHSYLLFSISAGKGYYNFESKTNYDVTTSKKLTYSPTIGYYHKSGLGLTATGYIVDDGTNMNFFQTGITPSFDYLKNKRIAAGISFTRFFTKDSLSFYTTPIQNELYAYFTYRKWWVRPTLALSYGWGSRTEYEERETIIQDLRLRRRGFTYINTKETISDLSVMASVRHDFYWLDVFTYRDHIRFTPQISFTSGTQKFGFNQSSTTYVPLVRNTSNVLSNTDNFYLDDELKFQPLSLTLYLRAEYSLGKFFIQPQFAVDYFFPASSRHFNTIFSVNAGFMF